MDLKNKSVQRGIQKILLNENDSRSSSTTNPSKTKASSQASTAPKQMTWASIASQPAKPTLRASSTSSILKKKGPGMPPPPMVPGKHNMDIGTWESPKSGPALVPPPPPPVVPVPIMEPFPLSQSKSNSGPSNNGPSTSSAHSGTNSITHIQTGHSANQQTQYQNQNLSGPPNIQNNPYNRPPWVSQNTNRPNNSSGTREVSQNQRSYIQKGMGQGMASSGNSSYHGQSQNQSEKVIQHEAPITQPPPAPSPILSNSSSNHPVLDELRDKNNYNPPEFDFDKAALARFFVIKSFAEDDIHRSIKYEIWCSTDHGNKRLDQAYRERESVGGIVYLFFSVNSSGHFCGMAQMISPVDYDSVSNVWSQNKWKGMFKVKWIYVKDVPNMSLRHIYLENNEDKPVTNSRDTQEVLSAKGLQVLKIFHTFERTTCIFEDFIHYEQIQEKERSKKNDNELPGPRNSSPGEPRRGGSDYERGYEKPGYHGGGGGGGYRDKTYGRGGGYHNFENRRHDDHRGGGGGYDRPHRDGGHDGHSSFTGYNRENNTDFHNTRGYHRGEYSRRDDRGHSGYNNSDRDRDNYNDGNNGAFMSRGDGQRGGAFRLNYNRSVQRGIQKILLDENDSRSSSTTNPSKTKASSQASTAPKQMTWASIASQPAKPTLRASSTSSILKRKGPGMAPPPMVPGKHNMDIGTWESPKSGPALVPPPPPPVVPVPIMEPFPLSQSKSNSGPSNNGPSTSSAHSGTNSTTHFQTGHSANQQTQYQNQNLSGPPNIQNNPYNRPLWVSQNTNRPNNSSGTREVSQNQRSYIQKGMGQGMALSGNSSYHGQSQNQSEKVIQHEAPITQPPPAPSPILSNSSSNHPVLDELRDKNNYNPPEFDFDKAALARFFVIKSFAEDDIHRSIKYEIWCSTDHGNKRLDQAYRERESVGGIVYLFFSVNSSGHFCGMAQMISPVDYDSVSNVWSQNKWNGMFKVKWIYVKDVPNMCLRHIYLENNEDKPVTYSRDTQEVLSAKGLQVLKIFHTFERTTCIFEDFIHYEQIQEKERSKKNDNELPGPRNSSPGEPRRGGSDYERGYEKPGYHGGGGGGGYRDKTYGRGGGYHNFENRRHDDHRGGGGGYDHPHRDGGHDGHSSFTGYNRENNTDFHNARGYHRGEYSRRDDRGHSGFNNRDRDRDNYNDGNNGAFMSRGDGQRGGSI